MTTPRQPNLVDRLLNVFSDVRAGEGVRALVLLVNVFLLLAAYYIIKTMREPMILVDGSAELRSFASAGQAAALLVFVPLYSWVSSRVPRRALIAIVSAFFVGCLALFYPAAVDAEKAKAERAAAEQVEEAEEGQAADDAALVETAPGEDAPEAADPDAADSDAAAPDDDADAAMAADGGDEPEIRAAPSLRDFTKLGFIFFVWVGIFNVAMIAQFWSFANDIYTREAGDRLFPIIGIGASAGAVIGSLVAGKLFDAGVSIPGLLIIAAAIIIVHAALLWVTATVADKESPQQDESSRGLTGAGGFALVLREPYLRRIAVVILLLNVVNSNGEYLLSRMVETRAEALLAAGTITDIGGFIGGFYGDFFSVVNVTSFLVQAFVVSRIVKFMGIRGVLFALPLVALSASALLAVGAGLGIYRWAKTAENTTDYSIMNTAKALVWLPTSPDEKYKAKQAIDTFVVRIGDLAATGFMVLGTQVFTWSIRGFAAVNIVICLVWLGLTASLVFHYRKRVEALDAR